MTKLNKADRTLLLAACVFLAALALHVAYPASTAADCFLFVAEAALVGGIADWFAVTALFEKPLGFPYHTAILPRRRKAFVNASVAMVQKEFFSKRKIIHHIEKLHLMPMMMDWLEKSSTREKIVREMLEYAQKFLSNDGMNETTATLAAKVRETLLKIPVGDFFAAADKELKESGGDKALLHAAVQYARERIGTDETRAAIRNMLDEYEKAQAKSPFELLMAGIAEALDFVNIDEAARLIQRQLLKLLDEADENEELRETLLALCREKTAELKSDENIAAMITNVRNEMVRALPVEAAITETLSSLREFVAAKNESGAPSAFENVFAAEFSRTIKLAREDEKLRRTAENLLYDLAARSALHAQKLIGTIVETVLFRLSDRELNNLVYDKVEPDLLWIRMNGSIVGSVVGLVLFVFLEIVK